MRKTIKYPSNYSKVTASSEIDDIVDNADPEVKEICTKLLGLVKNGKLSDDDYDIIREILYR